MTNGIVNMMYVLQRLGVTVLLAAVLSAASLSTLQAQEAAVNCDSGGQGLQKKIDSAAHGAEIFISGSCTDGPFFVSKDLKLIGAGPATLSAPNGSNNVVSARGAHVEFRNLTINADGVQDGIALAQSSAVIQNVLVEGATNNAVLLPRATFLRAVVVSMARPSLLLASDRMELRASPENRAPTRYWLVYWFKASR